MTPQFDENAAVFVISVAAELAGMHPQTLRQYDRIGLVSPTRSSGRGRRYSAKDVAKLREIQRLSQDEGVNLAGIKRVMELELQVEALQAKVRELSDDLLTAYQAMHRAQRIFAAGSTGDVVAMRPGRRPDRVPGAGELVLYRPPE